jgi:hypothetical protein
LVMAEARPAARPQGSSARFVGSTAVKPRRVSRHRKLQRGPSVEASGPAAHHHPSAARPCDLREADPAEGGRGPPRRVILTKFTSQNRRLR